MYSNEAVAQFSVLQNQFSPEFGGASGGVFNVILKSWDQPAHGSIYEYLQNRGPQCGGNTLVLNGNRTNPRLRQNRFGATIGGPIKKKSCSISGITSTIRWGRLPPRAPSLRSDSERGFPLLNGMSGVSKTNLGHI